MLAMRHISTHRFVLSNLAASLLLLAGACATLPDELTDLPPTVEAATPTWSRTSGLVAEPSPPSQVNSTAAQSQFILVNPDNPEEARSRQIQLLLANQESSLETNEIGYYMDILEARLIFALGESSISMSRAMDTIKLVLPGADSFDINRSVLKSQALSELSPVSSILAEYSSTRVSVHGHTDAQGDLAVNQRLSERRAFSVAQFLAEAGVRPNRLLIRGYGESEPISFGADEVNQAANRRIELLIEPVHKEL